MKGEETRGGEGRGGEGRGGEGRGGEVCRQTRVGVGAAGWQRLALRAPQAAHQHPLKLHCLLMDPKALAALASCTPKPTESPPRPSLRAARSRVAGDRCDPALCSRHEPSGLWHEEAFRLRGNARQRTELQQRPRRRRRHSRRFAAAAARSARTLPGVQKCIVDAHSAEPGPRRRLLLARGASPQALGAGLGTAPSPACPSRRVVIADARQDCCSEE